MGFLRVLPLSVLLLVMSSSGFAQQAPSTGTVHMPYDGQMCDSCHKMDAAGKPIPDAFTDKQPDLCFQCHDRNDKGKVKHPALETFSCTDCHSPHKSDQRFLLKQPIIDTCTQCHDAPGRDGKVPHSALLMKNSCVRCHEPHSADREKLLRDETQKLCFYCHTNIAKKIATPGAHVHPALEMGCTACHMPHGSDNAKLVVEKPNDLCFQCHDKDSFGSGHPRAGHPISGPRDPLYPEKPFTCVSCHKPHVSMNEKLFRYNYKPGVTPYDGTPCSVCHWQTMLPPPGPKRPKWDD